MGMTRCRRMPSYPETQADQQPGTTVALTGGRHAHCPLAPLTFLSVSVERANEQVKRARKKRGSPAGTNTNAYVRARDILHRGGLQITSRRSAKDPGAESPKLWCGRPLFPPSVHDHVTVQVRSVRSLALLCLGARQISPTQERALPWPMTGRPKISG